jgi:hypothetical protein
MAGERGLADKLWHPQCAIISSSLSLPLFLVVEPLFRPAYAAAGLIVDAASVSARK